MRTNEDAWQMVLEHSDIAYATAIHRRVVKGYRRFTVEELASAAMLAMFKIALRYDATRGVPLDALLWRYATYGIKEAAREVRELPAEVLDAQEPEDDAPVGSVHVVRDELVALLAVLGARARELICRRYGLDGYEPATQLGVANRLGVTRQAVAKMEGAALARMRRHALGMAAPPGDRLLAKSVSANG